MEILTKAKDEDDLAPAHRAEGGRLGGELDHDEPPDGEREGEPGGHGVDHHCEVGVEHHEDSPNKRILKREVTNLIIINCCHLLFGASVFCVK